MARNLPPLGAGATRPCRAAATGVSGDVLVRTVPVGASAAYTVSEIPGPDQVRFASLADAARLARDYARERGVDVWSDDGAGRVEQLSRFRPSVAAPGRPAEQSLAAAENVSATHAVVDEMTGEAPGT